jgi:hypothetical protein
MSQSNSTQALIDAAIVSLRSREAFNHQLQRKVLAYQKKAAIAGSAYRQTIFEKIYASAGIDPSEITRRQAYQNSEAKKFIDSLLPEISANSEVVQKRHEAQAKWALHKPIHHPPGPPPPPPPDAGIAEFLYTATNISFDNYPEEVGQVTHSSSIAYGNNVARIKVDGSLSGPPFCTYISFVWTPPRDGELIDVAGWVSANGSHWWSSQHKCIEAHAYNPAEAILMVIPQGAVLPPMGVSGGFLQIDQGIILDFDWEKFPGCATDTGAEVIDQFLTLSSWGEFSIPVSANVPIVIMIIAGIDVRNTEAHSVVDFETGAQAFNVPGVFLAFQ